MIDYKVDIPKNLDHMDLDRKVVMKGLRKCGALIRARAKNIISKKGLRKCGALIRARAKNIISKKGRSKPGEYPGRQSGAMRNAVKIISAKRKDRFWVRVQVNIPQGAEMFYPAVLNYGRRDGTLKPRLNPITDASDQLQTQVQNVVDDAVYSAIKIWK